MVKVGVCFRILGRELAVDIKLFLEAVRREIFMRVKTASYNASKGSGWPKFTYESSHNWKMI